MAQVTFRTHTSAAPLKRAGADADRLPRCPFRTHTSAAPLKPVWQTIRLSSVMILPHSHECGPVEAAIGVHPAWVTKFLPHSHECGPVEANRANTPGPCSASLPHSHECGPVEAIRCFHQ